MQQYDKSQNNFAKWKKPESPLRNVHAMTAFIRNYKKMQILIQCQEISDCLGMVVGGREAGLREYKGPEETSMERVYSSQ